MESGVTVVRGRGLPSHLSFSFDNSCTVYCANSGRCRGNTGIPGRQASILKGKDRANSNVVLELLPAPSRTIRAARSVVPHEPSRVSVLGVGAGQDPNADVEREVPVKFTIKIEADSLRQAMSKAGKQYPSARYLRRQSMGWYSIDVVEAIDRALVRNAFGGPFTGEEQLNPDVILNNVPANSSQEVIRTARKRFHRLRRLLIMREFCVANLGLSFQRPGNTSGGVSRVQDLCRYYRVNRRFSRRRSFGSNDVTASSSSDRIS